MMTLVTLFLLFFTVHLMKTFTEHLKHAKGSPIFEVGNNDKAGNYKPTAVSVLPIFSKVLQRIMSNRT